MMHNNLFVNRLIIYTKDNLIAYDEEFHHGINIIRGKNSSGKSTIIHPIPINSPFTILMIPNSW